MPSAVVQIGDQRRERTEGIRRALRLITIAMAVVLVGCAAWVAALYAGAAISNVMKTKHDTVKNSISNVR